MYAKNENSLQRLNNLNPIEKNIIWLFWMKKQNMWLNQKGLTVIWTRWVRTGWSNNPAKMRFRYLEIELLGNGKKIRQ